MTYSASDAALVRAVSVLVRRIGTGGDGNLLGFTRTSTHAHWWAHLRVLCTRPRARCRLLRSHTAQAAARIASNLHVMTLRSAWSPHDGPWYRCGGHGGDHAKTRDHHTERYDARIAHFRELRVWDGSARGWATCGPVDVRMYGVPFTRSFASRGDERVSVLRPR